jgi:hypothetical protein
MEHGDFVAQLEHLGVAGCGDTARAPIVDRGCTHITSTMIYQTTTQRLRKRQTEKSRKCLDQCAVFGRAPMQIAAAFVDPPCVVPTLACVRSLMTKLVTNRSLAPV